MPCSSTPLPRRSLFITCYIRAAQEIDPFHCVEMLTRLKEIRAQPQSVCAMQQGFFLLSVQMQTEILL